jgi:hypothetical protein
MHCSALFFFKGNFKPLSQMPRPFMSGMRACPGNCAQIPTSQDDLITEQPNHEASSDWNDDEFSYWRERNVVGELSTTTAAHGFQ